MIQLPPNFFEDIWQQKPCLLKQATAWRPEITPDELAGIACEDTSRARIIHENPNANDSERWLLEEGPFDQNHFSQLPETHWTLLVQDLNSWDEQVAQLLQVPCIPQWRIQDIMCSYAVDQGSVGPHFDHYDVFLVQGLGQRLWQVGPACNDQTPLLDHKDLLLLKEMQVEQTFLLEPGDILYVPPSFAHWGIAQGECMTFSIGFRAPSAAETLQELSDQIVPELLDHQRYQDSIELLRYHQQHQRQHEIAPAALAQLRALIMQSLDDKALCQWLGNRSTAQEQLPLLETLDAKSFAQLWEKGQFVRHPELTLLWSQTNDRAQIYCHGITLEIQTNLTPAEEAHYLECFASQALIDVHQPPFAKVATTPSIVQWLLELEALGPTDTSLVDDT